MPTAWRYIVPYQPDFQQALDALRQTVFERGTYLQPWTDRALQPSPPPADIEEVHRRNGEQGTHSILDIERISLVAGPGLAALVPDATRQRIFGTTRPSPEDVDDHRFALAHHLEDGHAAFLVLYDREGAPCRLYFEGLTGG